MGVCEGVGGREASGLLTIISNRDLVFILRLLSLFPPEFLPSLPRMFWRDKDPGTMMTMVRVKLPLNNSSALRTHVLLLPKADD